MANRKIKVLGLILISIVILFITGLIGYSVSSKIVVNNSKKIGKELTFIPEKIVKLETKYKNKAGIHFRGESGKLYSCNNSERFCEVISPEPPEYLDNGSFVKTDKINTRFAQPNSKYTETVIRTSRGISGHRTISQYALLHNGKVLHWIYSGNEMGDSFPFWHLNNWLSLAIGTFCGLFSGFIISVIIWVTKSPRN